MKSTDYEVNADGNYRLLWDARVLVLQLVATAKGGCMKEISLQRVEANR